MPLHKNTPLKVGFDLDGVLLYNPLRVGRWPISVFKRVFQKQNYMNYYPKSAWEKKIWRMLHWSSFIVHPSYHRITELVREGKIEAYIITARFGFLEDDFRRWLKKMHADEYFKGTFINKDDKHPHDFKEEMVKKLGLDMYVEDNFDIASHVEKTTQASVIWIYNLVDHFRHYPLKAAHLGKALNMIESKVEKRLALGRSK